MGGGSLYLFSESSKLEHHFEEEKEEEERKSFPCPLKTPSHPYFPLSLQITPLVSKGPQIDHQTLCAYGRRIVLQLFTAYELGVYVDKVGISELSLLKKEKQVTDQEAIDGLMTGPFSKTLRLVTFRTVPSQHLLGGWEKSLWRKMKEIQPQYEMSDDDLEALFKHFASFLPKEVGKGVPLHMVWRPWDSMECYIDQKMVLEVQSKLLCEALFDIYLGKDSVTPELRKNFVAHFSD
eukprot:CAMPEP_0201479434 /NCGR_PEP_ID=MMETSP0151_2-20130828/4130_1 /ASSEMBLY_ACC=CAM_ASM_000257 /TAXON_ID=200890 /ORGANISM="Paramoeba atlantica, Strain 621/1 / CCAP 1560/9" /LENGTH=235 /DNA_ID=CAMNT_0047860927 /DNA_START=364 /DNA_END=1071 /DNA_ORIENTATION=-